MESGESGNLGLRAQGKKVDGGQKYQWRMKKWTAFAACNVELNGMCKMGSVKNVQVKVRKVEHGSADEGKTGV